MSRILVIAVLLAAAGASAYYILTRPEPTPAERLENAAQEAGDAVGEAAQAVTEAASEAVQNATQQANEAASSVSQQASDAADQASAAVDTAAQAANEQIAALGDQGNALIQSWQDSGILTEAGFDYDKMMTAVQASPLTESVKAEAATILADIKAAPDTFAEKFEELKKLLAQ